MKSYHFPYAIGPDSVIFSSHTLFTTDEPSFTYPLQDVGIPGAILIGDVGEIVWFEHVAGELGSWRKQR